MLAPVLVALRAWGDGGTGGRSLRARVGVDAARPLLRAEASELRVRAFERLGTTNRSAAVGLLAHALGPDGEARNARERLAAVRALAPRAGEELAKSALIRAMAGAQSRDEPKDALVRDTAGLALARAHDARGLELLAQALRQAGRTAQTARLSLAAHPPSSIAPLLDARGAPSEALVELFGELGDRGAAELLESVARGGSPALRPKALAALANVEPERALGVARALARDRDTAVRVACARVVALAGAPEAPALVRTLFADPATAESAVEIALDAHRSDLGAVLAAGAPPPGAEERYLGALGRSGGEPALRRLETALGGERSGWAAAYALALSADDDAGATLARALEIPAQRRNAVRAAALRLAASGRTTPHLDRALASLRASRSAADRAAFAFAVAVTAPERGAELLAHGDRVARIAVARASLSPELAPASCERLAVEADPVVAAALSPCLALPAAADRVPTGVLTALVESRGAAAYLAAAALAARDSDRLRPRLRELLASGDPLLRAHVALGLAQSDLASAAGLLADAYRFEVDPRVRRAIVSALARRCERARRATLGLAAALDPDRDARNTARRALAGRREPSAASALNRDTAWLMLPEETKAEGTRVLLVITADGLGLPFAADPDGAVLAVDLPKGAVEVWPSAAAPGLPAPAAATAP